VISIQLSVQIGLINDTTWRLLGGKQIQTFRNKDKTVALTKRETLDHNSSHDYEN